MAKQIEVKDDPRYKIIHDHGFCGLVETMGSDESICQSARVSYGDGTKSVNDDRNLLRYLVRHKHTSPLEMAEIRFHIKLPILVMRQWIRHRTANVNEYSGRYSEMVDEFYVIEESYIQKQSKTNKQGGEAGFNSEEKGIIIDKMKKVFDFCYKEYKEFLDMDLSRETARSVLPVANYTECYWKIDLHNLFHFLGLRMDPHAQREIRDFANIMYDMVKVKYPLACEAFYDYKLNSVTLSLMDRYLLADRLSGKSWESIDTLGKEHYKMSKREWDEFMNRWRNNLPVETVGER